MKAREKEGNKGRKEGRKEGREEKKDPMGRLSI